MKKTDSIIKQSSQSEKELFFRAIKRSRPDCIEKGRVTSALFKEKAGEGISVDREAGRREIEIVSFILNGKIKGRVKGIAKFSSQICIDIDAEIKETPNADNPYHVDIYLNQENEQIQNVQAWQLARACEVIYEDKNMAWTGR